MLRCSLRNFTTRPAGPTHKTWPAPPNTWYRQGRRGGVSGAGRPGWTGAGRGQLFTTSWPPPGRTDRTPYRARTWVGEGRGGATLGCHAPVTPPEYCWVGIVGVQPDPGRVSAEPTTAKQQPRRLSPSVATATLETRACTLPHRTNHSPRNTFRCSHIRAKDKTRIFSLPGLAPSKSGLKHASLCLGSKLKVRLTVAAAAPLAV